MVVVGLLCVCLGAGTSFGQGDAGRTSAPIARAVEPGQVGSAPPPPATGDPQAPIPRLDTRTQYPRFLADSYFIISAGSIQYPFTSQEMEPGFQVESISIRHAAARVALIGHQFSRYLAAEAVYMRPVKFITYRNVNGDGSPHHVWMNFGSVTLKPQLPVSSRVSAYGELGFGVTSRHGFAVDGVPVVRDAQFTSGIVGGGLDFHVNRTWDLTVGGHYSPGREEERQPATVMWSGGFRYNMRPLSPELVAANRETGCGIL